jgi:DNA-binding transcriptional regulator YiaG
LRQLGLSQRRFAFMVQKDVRTVNRWATGKQPPPHWVRSLVDCMIKSGGD